MEGYHQVPKDPGDICKIALVMPFGLSEFLSMPFGLMNTAQTFQRLINQIFRGLPYIFLYLDDVLGEGTDRETQLKHLRVVLNLLV